MEYDIFISYRRDGGYDTAKHLYDLLENDGYSVSFDIDTLRSGDFDIQLYERIENCKDFILILDKDVFVRSIDPQVSKEHDWVRCELAHALKNKLNIIPIFLKGFSDFPDNLPDDICEIRKKNGIRYNRDYFDAFYNNIKSRFLISKPKTSYVKRISLIAIVLVSIICIGQLILSISDRKDNGNNFLILRKTADSLVKVSYNLLDDTNGFLRGGVVEKLQNSVVLYDKCLKCNVSDSLEYKAVLKKINSVQEILDSCNVYNDLSQYYMQLIAEKSVIAAAECDEQRRSTLQNIKKLLMSL